MAENPAPPATASGSGAPARPARRGRDNAVMTSDQRDDGAGAELLADADRPRAWMLLAGGVPQSYVDLDDPRHLELEYMRRLGHVLDLAAPAGAPLRVLHLGGGALTLARYVAATRPGSQQLAAESDAAVARLVAERLPAGPGGISVRVADARQVLEQAGAGSFDVVVADAFTGAVTPARLTSAEFTAAALRALAPGGLFAVNISDGPPLAHARGRVAAIRSVFSHACVIAEPAVLDGRQFGNLVAAAARRELPAAELARRAAADPVPAQLLSGSALDRFTGGAAPVTDARPVPPAVPPPDVYI
jgi:spermidine synthase